MIAALLLLQAVTGCQFMSDAQVATSTDRPKLRAEIDCARKAADTAVKPRAARLTALDKAPAPKPTPATTPKPSPAPTPLPSFAPPASIASNFARASYIGDGGRIPASGWPDVVGAFRFVCQPSHARKDDPIVWPSQPGAAHLHEFFGNTLADANSTFASLRTTGASTCMNVLNRSAYWYPALLDERGNVIRADEIPIYYKRRPASDPECRRIAANGCVALPNGLKLVADVNHFRCTTGAQLHRSTIAEAISDCGGRGKVMAAVNFGSCWNGKTESADHRSHVVAFIRDGSIAGAPERCPVGYDYVIPELTQGIIWTIEPGDGAVRFSAPHFHADYFTAWDEPTLKTWTADCIDKLRSCVDGELGDGTIMKRWPGFGYTANPRVVAAPSP